MKLYITTMDSAGLEARDGVLEAPSLQALVDELFPGDEIRGEQKGRRDLFDPELGYVWAQAWEVEGITPASGHFSHKTSTTGWCQRRPLVRSYVQRGQVIHTSRTGIIFVPLKATGGQSWDCQVVAGTDVYAPNGYGLSVGEDELLRGTLITQEALRGLVP